MRALANYPRPARLTQQVAASHSTPPPADNAIMAAIQARHFPELTESAAVAKGEDPLADFDALARCHARTAPGF